MASKQVLISKGTTRIYCKENGLWRPSISHKVRLATYLRPCITNFILALELKKTRGYLSEIGSVLIYKTMIDRDILKLVFTEPNLLYY